MNKNSCGSKEYIVDDIIDIMKERGVKLWFYIKVLL